MTRYIVKRINNRITNSSLKKTQKTVPWSTSSGQTCSQSLVKNDQPAEWNFIWNKTACNGENNKTTRATQ